MTQPTALSISSYLTLQQNKESVYLKRLNTLSDFLIGVDVEVTDSDTRAIGLSLEQFHSTETLTALKYIETAIQAVTFTSMSNYTIGCKDAIHDN